MRLKEKRLQRQHFQVFYKDYCGMEQEVTKDLARFRIQERHLVASLQFAAALLCKTEDSQIFSVNIQLGNAMTVDRAI